MATGSQLKLSSRVQNSAVAYVIGCVLFFAAINIIVGLPFIGGPHVDFFFGSLARAEIALHSIWFVFAPLGSVRRLLFGIAIALFVFAAWQFVWLRFIFLSSGAPVLWSWWATVTAQFLSLPILAIGAQSPLWAARIWLRWRIERTPSDIPLRCNDAAFGIRHVLYSMVFFGLGLTMAKMAGVIAANRVVSLESSTEEAIVLGVVSLAIVMPLVVAILHCRRLGLALFYTVSLYLPAVGLWCLLLFLDKGPTIRLIQVERIATLTDAYFLSLALPLFLARFLGYRLVWGRAATRLNREMVGEG